MQHPVPPLSKPQRSGSIPAKARYACFSCSARPPLTYALHPHALALVELDRLLHPALLEATGADADSCRHMQACGSLSASRRSALWHAQYSAHCRHRQQPAQLPALPSNL